MQTGQHSLGVSQVGELVFVGGTGLGSGVTMSLGTPALGPKGSPN